jgi:GH25 family lysozyme M1 (1,4-beta-N-acetylmuramidase)
MDIRTIDIYAGNLYNRYGQRKVIDWQMVKLSPLNVRAVWCKFGEGYWDGYPEDTTIEITEGARAAGIETGGYHYAYGEYPVSTQGAYIKRRVLGRNFKRLAGDFEYASCPPRVCKTQADITLYWGQAQKNLIFVRDYLDMLDQIGGDLATGYSAQWWLSWLLWIAGVKGFDVSKIVNRPWWVASYTLQMVNIFGIDLANVVQWQYGNKGVLQGMPYPEKIDTNLWLKSEAEFNTFWKIPVIPVEFTLEEKVNKLWGIHPELRA